MGKAFNRQARMAFVLGQAMERKTSSPTIDNSICLEGVHPGYEMYDVALYHRDRKDTDVFSYDRWILYYAGNFKDEKYFCQIGEIGRAHV